MRYLILILASSAQLLITSSPMFQSLLTQVSSRIIQEYNWQAFYCSHEEILADDEGNARCSPHRIDNSDHTWIQWALAQCSQVSVKLFFPCLYFWGYHVQFVVCKINVSSLSFADYWVRWQLFLWYHLLDLGSTSLAFQGLVCLLHLFVSMFLPSLGSGQNLCMFVGSEMRRNWPSRSFPVGCIFSGTDISWFLHGYLLCSMSCTNTAWSFSQYLSQVLDFGKSVFSRFSVLFTVSIVWLYAYILTIGGAYKNSPQKTQVHCRVDRSGLISGARW